MNHQKHYFRCKYLDWHKPSIEHHVNQNVNITVEI